MGEGSDVIREPAHSTDAGNFCKDIFTFFFLTHREGVGTSYGFAIKSTGMLSCKIFISAKRYRYAAIF